VKKITQSFDVTVKVAEKDRGWLWLQVNMGSVEQPEGTYEVQFNKGLSIKTPDGKVIVTVPLEELVGKMIEIAKNQERK
jgi:hypothetical protein